MKSTLKKRLLIITAALERDNSEQAQAFCRMAPFIFKAVVQVAQATKASEEDILGEVLCAFSAARDFYQTPVYKYHKSLYQCSGGDADTLLLETPKANKVRKSLRVKRSEAVEVRRAKFASFLYNKIQQHCVDILRGSFMGKRDISIEMVSLDSLDDGFLGAQVDFSSDPESLFSAAQMYHEIIPRLSDQARAVLDLFVEGAFTSDKGLANGLRMSMGSVAAAKQEILRAYHLMERSFVQDEDLQPIYLKASDL